MPEGKKKLHPGFFRKKFRFDGRDVSNLKESSVDEDYRVL